jgi:hypothetical protein
MFEKPEEVGAAAATVLKVSGEGLVAAGPRDSFPGGAPFGTRFSGASSLTTPI